MEQEGGYKQGWRRDPDCLSRLVCKRGVLIEQIPPVFLSPFPALSIPARLSLLQVTAVVTQTSCNRPHCEARAVLSLMSAYSTGQLTNGLAMQSCN